VIHTQPGANLRQYVVFFGLAIRRDEDSNGLSDQLSTGVAEEPFSCSVAGLDDAIEIFGDDRIVR
jgi:hypothetical protein